MKNKTTKTIACVIVGLTLSACMKEPENVTYENVPNKGILNSNSVTSGQDYEISCFFTPCVAGISTAINIKPLKDTAGTAIYSGALDAQRAIGSQFQTYSGDIDIRVDFSAKTFRESATIRAGITSHSFRMNGIFTDNGGITGTATISSTTAPLTGVIGATQMIGVFRSDTMAGGFTAFRE